MTAETLTAEPARTHVVRCGCGASAETRYDDPKEVEFFMEHRECLDVLVADDPDEFGPGAEALVGARLVAWALANGAGQWRVYAVSDGPRTATPIAVGSRRKAEAVLQMMADAYLAGRRG